MMPPAINAAINTVNNFRLNMKTAHDFKFLSLPILFLMLMIVSYALAAEGFKTTARGAQYKDLKSGTGDVVQTGDVITIHFTGWLDNRGVKGKEIYNTRKQNKPVSFVVGTSRVMQGWNEGVTGMQVGGKRMVHIPPGLAYGSRKIEDDIPANASLIFIFDVVGLEKKQ
jgi:FKBP-type peptidyl-prolyl cis-trans isomerase